MEQRAEIIRLARVFFDSRHYLETDTPLLAPDLIPESCLEVFETMRIPPAGSRAGAQPYWLIPSPEIWMKKLIAEHRVNIYQICKCFRNGESAGHLHNPEFSMLEYYTMDADYIDSLALTEELFAYLFENLKLSNLFAMPFRQMTVEEAFARWVGFDLYKTAASPQAMEAEARRLGLDPMPGLDAGALYDLIFIHAVEPRLAGEGLTALLDYPAFVPCLAKKNPDGKTVERWELYANGIELANCYSEETNPAQVRAFFESEAAAKEKSALVRHHVDHDYWKIFQPKNGQGFPRCSGVALGLDRLIMLLTGHKTIDGVLPFTD